MKNFRTTVVHATPSYLLHLYEALADDGMSYEKLCLRKAFIGAEPHSEQTRVKIEELFGIKAYNSYGLSEMNGPGVAFECVYQTGLHLWEDAYIPVSYTHLDRSHHFGANVTRRNGIDCYALLDALLCQRLIKAIDCSFGRCV